MSTADIEDLLQPGETIEEEVDLGRGTVVVTNRRVLTFSPATAGKNYRHVERPNVDNVAIRTRSDGGRLVSAGAALAAAAALVVVGIVLDFSGVLSVPTGPGASAIGVGGMLDSFRSMLAMIDDAILLLGAISGVAGLAFVGLYLHSRERVVSIDVAGENDVDFPTAGLEDPRGAVESLRLALGISLEHGDTEGGPEWETNGD